MFFPNYSATFAVIVFFNNGSQYKLAK